MWHISAAITVGIANGKDTSLTGTHTAGNIDLVTDDAQVHLGWKCRGLNGWDVDNNSIPVNRFAGSEVKAELVELLVTVFASVVPAILKALNGRDCAVIDGSVPSGKLFLPVFDLGRCPGLAIGSLRAVHECNDVGVQSVSLQHVAQHIGDITDHSKWLVPVFVAIAPRAPEDAVAPSLPKARSRGQNVTDTGTEHDFTGSVVLALAVSYSEGREISLCERNDRFHSLVGEVGSWILLDLLASQTSESSRWGT